MAPLGRRLWARAIDVALSLLILFIIGIFVPAPRLVAYLLLGVGALTAFEALFVIQLGATPGKLATGLRVAELDRPRVDQTTAWTRGLVATIGSLSLILAGPAVLVMVDSVAGFAVGGLALAIAGGYVLSIVTFPSHRGVADRIAGTIVVPFEAPAVVTRADVDAEDDRPRVVTAWGPVAAIESRRRARAARLDDSPLLVVALVAVTAAWTFDVMAVAIALAVLFAVLLVIDEAARIGRDGGTAGHRREGLAVLDEATGEAPGRGPALARAVTLAVFWLFPPLLVALAIWVQLSPTGRGPHDLVAGTVVVEVPGGAG
ncbi:MAG TPA: RDD family protein [Iamia sp.]|nr:RDD family protein [Iamia sp.]